MRKSRKSRKRCGKKLKFRKTKNLAKQKKTKRKYLTKRKTPYNIIAGNDVFEFATKKDLENKTPAQKAAEEAAKKPTPRTRGRIK